MELSLTLVVVLPGECLVHFAISPSLIGCCWLRDADRMPSGHVCGADPIRYFTSVSVGSRVFILSYSHASNCGYNKIEAHAYYKRSDSIIFTRCTPFPPILSHAITAHHALIRRSFRELVMSNCTQPLCLTNLQVPAPALPRRHQPHSLPSLRQHHPQHDQKVLPQPMHLLHRRLLRLPRRPPQILLRPPLPLRRQRIQLIVLLVLIPAI
jgi:hypothetical protein